MAFFKFRKAADDAAKTPPQPQSIESMRQRAKHRLAGATVLVVIGVIAFPLLFDKQPRPIAVDTPIDIPDRNKVPPLVMPVASAPKALPAEPASAVVAAASQPEVSKAIAPATSAPVVITELADKKVPLAPVKPEDTASKGLAADLSKPVKAAASAASKPAAADRGVPEAKPTQAASAPTGRFILQVGAFADATRAHEVRVKLERAGLKTYTQVAETPDGKRIRVRVGPFTAKAEAEKTAVKIKKLDLPAALLTL